MFIAVILSFTGDYPVLPQKISAAVFDFDQLKEQEQADREWQPDEWIRTSVWILEELAVDGPRKGQRVVIYPKELTQLDAVLGVHLTVDGVRDVGDSGPGGTGTPQTATRRPSGYP
jgi:hypothetical protein